MDKGELVKIKVDAAESLAGVDLLPDVLRQLSAMVRLLGEFMTDKSSKVEVLSLEKHSPLVAELRVISLAKAGNGKGRPPRVKGLTRPVRRLEAVLASARNERGRMRDITTLTAVKDVIESLKGDVATVSTAKDEFRLDRELVAQINRKLGPSYFSRGTITGAIESLNVHTKPWTFTIYPKVGPKKVRCTFDDALFLTVQSCLRMPVRITGLKEYFLDSPWPAKMNVSDIEPLPPNEGLSWISFIDDLRDEWEAASEEERYLSCSGWSDE